MVGDGVVEVVYCFLGVLGDGFVVVGDGLDAVLAEGVVAHCEVLVFAG